MSLPVLAAILVISMAIISVGGWVWETTYCSIVERRFVRRGFLFGPSLPIYGTGAVAVYVLLGWCTDPLVVFVLGAALATAIELATGTVLERLYGRRWWDYSAIPINYKGHICALASAVFGFFSVLVVFLIEPALIELLAGLGGTLCLAIASGVVGLFGIDLVATLLTLNGGRRLRIAAVIRRHRRLP